MNRFSRYAIAALTLSLPLATGCVVDTSDRDRSGDDEVIVLDKPMDDGKADSVTSRYIMHFYPQLIEWEGRWEETGVLLLAKDSEYIFATYARGGPEQKNGTAGATPSGSYQVSSIGPKEGSSRWPMSIVRWGATITVDQNDAGRVTAVYEHFTDMGGNPGTKKLASWKLSWVNTKDFDEYIGLVFHDTNQSGTIEAGEQTVDNMHFAEQVESGAPIYTNDFGHMSSYMGKHGVYLHPTSPMYDGTTGEPSKECSTMSGSCYLADSHGCVHVAPAAIDYLIGNGWLRRRSAIVVHGYDEAPPPEAAALLAGLPDVDAARGHVSERDSNCACDYYDGVCEAAMKGALLTCECDLDCYAAAEPTTACSADKHCDTWCPAGGDPDCK